MSSIATRTVIAALRHWEGESVSLNNNNNSNVTITLYEESLERIVRRVGGERVGLGTCGRKEKPKEKVGCLSRDYKRREERGRREEGGKERGTKRVRNQKNITNLKDDT